MITIRLYLNEWEANVLLDCIDTYEEETRRGLGEGEFTEVSDDLWNTLSHLETKIRTLLKRNNEKLYGTPPKPKKKQGDE